MRLELQLLQVRLQVPGMSCHYFGVCHLPNFSLTGIETAATQSVLNKPLVRTLSISVPECYYAQDLLASMPMLVIRILTY